MTDASPGPLPTPRWFVPVVFVGWALFTAWLLAGFPPPVDLAGHAAQFETLAGLVRGDADVSRYYEIRFPQAYGLDYWVFLPLALLARGAFAAKVDFWLALQLFVWSVWALLRTFKRSHFTLLFALPLAFNLSYWYGYVTNLMAESLFFFSVAAFARALETKRWKWLLVLNALAAATLLTHLLAFAALCAGLGAWAIWQPPRRERLLRLAAGLGLPVLLSLPKVWFMAHRALTPGDWAPTEYGALSHLNWFIRNYRPEGWLAAWGPLAVTAVFVGAWWRRRRVEGVGPAVLTAAMTLLYLATPKTLSGITLISVRLPVFAGVLVLLLVDAGAFHPWLRRALVVVCAFSLVETAIFHARFKASVAGLDEMLTPERPPRHAYLSLAGRDILGSRNVYLEHLGQWLTATRGGVGHDFFADAEHHPARFKPGIDIPADLWVATPAQRRWFDELLTFGEGPLPEGLQDWRLERQAGRWRKWTRVGAGSPDAVMRPR